MFRKMISILVGSVMLLQGLTISPVFALEEQYQYERTKVIFSAKEGGSTPFSSLNRTFNGRYKTCNSQIYDTIEKKYGSDGFKAYTLDSNNGSINLITPYSIKSANLLESPVMYRYGRYGVIEKITIEVIEKSNGGALYYMMSLPTIDDSRFEETSIQDDLVTSPAAIKIEPSFRSLFGAQARGITDPVDPPQRDECQLIVSVCEVNIVTSLSPNKEIITAGATTYPLDGILGGYYYKRLGVARFVPPPELKVIQAIADAHSLIIISTAENVSTDLDPSPYQVAVNNNISEWLPQGYYQVNALVANTSYVLTVRLKNLKGQVTEKTLSKTTLAEKPNLEIIKLTDKDVSLKITDQNPPNTKYQIKVGGKYVLENGQMSATEQWITIPTKQIKVIEKLTTTNNKISIKARNEENVATDETVTSIVMPEIKAVQATAADHSITIAVSSINKAAELDSKPYQITINNKTSEWLAQPHYEAKELLANTNYTMTVRVKGITGQVAEKTLSKTTLAEKPNLEVVKLTDKDVSLKITDQNPPNTKYQIKVGGKYVLENGQMSATEQWITIPTKQIKVIEKLTTTNNKISIKARNEENVATGETILVANVVPLVSLIKSAKVVEGTYSIKLKLSPSVSTKMLDKTPYQFIINGQATEWSKLRYFTFTNLIPNTNYNLIIRVKDQNGLISELNLTSKTHPQEQTSTYKYDDVSALLEIEQSETKDMFTYDSFGNLIKENFTTK